MHRLAVLVLAFVLLLPAATRAKEGPVVARLDGTVLRAHRDGGRLCLVLTYRRTGSDQCEPAPRSPFEPTVSDAGEGAIGYAFPAGVAAVTSDRGGRVTRYETAGAPSLAARFVLVPRARVGDAVIRAYDGAGSLVGASQDEFIASSADGSRPVFRGPGVVLRAKVTRLLAPDLAELDHTSPAVCLYATLRGSAQGDCRTTLPRFEVTTAPRCGRRGSVVAGVVPASVAAVEVVLGSGRVLRRATRPLPGVPGQRLVAVLVPRGEAVRRAVGRDAGGAVIGIERLGAAPAGGGCGFGDFRFEDGRRFTGLGRRTSTPVPVAADGGHVALAADGTRRTLCLSVDIPAKPSCLPTPVLPDDQLLVRRGRTVAGVFSAAVVRVDLRLTDRRTIRAPTQPGPAYTGRFAGRVRFLAVRLPAGAVVARAVARDAAGSRVGSPALVLPREGRVTRRPVAPGLQLVRTAYVFDGGRMPFVCVASTRLLTADDQASVCKGPYESREVSAIVTCSPRRLIVLGLMHPGGTGVTVALTGGRRVTARIRRIRGLGRFWSVTVPRRAGVLAVDRQGPLRRTRAGRPRRHVRFVLPPAARQCGYTTQDRGD